MKMTEATGRCLCGGVTFTVNDATQNVEACHCSMCRRWGGGPLMAVNCGESVDFEGKENITLYDSSQWAERGFCKNCGTHLYYRLKERNEHQIQFAGIYRQKAAILLL